MTLSPATCEFVPAIRALMVARKRPVESRIAELERGDHAGKVTDHEDKATHREDGHGWHGQGHGSARRMGDSPGRVGREALDPQNGVTAGNSPLADRSSDPH